MKILATQHYFTDKNQNRSRYFPFKSIFEEKNRKYTYKTE